MRDISLHVSFSSLIVLDATAELRWVHTGAIDRSMFWKLLWQVQFAPFDRSVIFQHTSS